MAFQSKDGKKHNSKFRAGRADREHESASKPEGQRAQANELEGKKQMSAKGSAGQENPSPAPDQEGGAPQEPGMQQSKARELHMHFDDNMGMHHVHAIDENGVSHHSDHPSRAHAMKQAHMHAGEGQQSDEFGDRESPDAEKHPNDDFEPELEDTPAMGGGGY